MKPFEKNIHINNIKMLHYGRINISEGIDVRKASASKEYYLSLLVFFR